jgi:hypothetical protein
MIRPMLVSITLFVAPLVSGDTLAAQAAADSSAIRAVALDYAEGWYTGDSARMARALHPRLAKRIVMTRPGSESRLGDMTAEQLIHGTAQGGGSRTPAAGRQADVQILDIFRNAASVRLTMSDWIDYLHVAKWNDQWVVINVLWEMKPRQGQGSANAGSD